VRLFNEHKSFLVFWWIFKKMQNSSSSSKTTNLGSGYAPFVSAEKNSGTSGMSGTRQSETTTSSSTTTMGGYSTGIEQRVREMESGAQRVVTNQSIREEQARQPVKEYTEFVEKPKVEQPTQYYTQQRVMEKEEAPIKLKQQEIQHVEQKTVVQEQPVIIRKQEVQLEKEAPIQVTKQTTQHQTLPAIEKKELYIQPVEHTAGPDRILSSTTTESGAPVTYNVKAEQRTAEAIESGSYEHQGIKGHLKETMGGVKAAAHNVMEKAREVFHTTGSTTTSTTDQTRRETPST
jgi:hypothetical protein